MHRAQTIGGGTIRDITQTRERFLRYPWAVRMGHLASNLARISNLARQPGTDRLVSDLLRESAWFVEWTALQAPVETAIELADVGRELCLWRRVQPLSPARQVLSFRARALSGRVLELSGLLKT